ncbi:uncharacterized protein LOC108108471 [Drosophila eugracilis]|uniref:uncharacterized protein LOC108108471 n=1 Tax=Drosophila eugracilis TaxID=29029 RepID=UPI0007E85CAA|nr:uncharacterized protein LOC108108471 [Drosophila eugracilis]
MTRGMRMLSEGLSRMQNGQKTILKPSRKPVQSPQISGRNTSPISLKYKVKPMTQPDYTAMFQRDYKTEKRHTDRQTLADIVIMQARRIERLRREMHLIKAHYERQVSTIKNNAIMLESHLAKVLSNVNRDRAKRITHHYQDMFGAVEKLQKSGTQFKPKSVPNQMLNKFSDSKAISLSPRKTKENMRISRKM